MANTENPQESQALGDTPAAGGQAAAAPQPHPKQSESGAPHAANEAMYKVMARLIVAWKVYQAFDPDAVLEIDPEADPAELLASLGAGEQKRIGAITSENVGRLPLAIINRIGEEIGRVADPQ